MRQAQRKRKPWAPKVGDAVFSRVHGPAVLHDLTAGEGKARILLDEDILAVVSLSSLSPPPTVRADWFWSFGDRDPHVKLKPRTNFAAAVLDATGRLMEAQTALPFGSWCDEFKAHIVPFELWPAFKSCLLRAGAHVTGPAAAAGEDED